MPLLVNANVDLTESLVRDVLSREVVIKLSRCVSDRPPGIFKKFTFNPWDNEYTIWVDDRHFDGGNALEELIEAFDSL